MEWQLRCMAGLQLVIRLLMRLWRLLALGPRPPPCLPPLAEPLLALSATKLAQRIRQGEVSSVGATEAYVQRIRAVNPFLNAVVEERFAAALEEATACDRHLDALRSSSAPEDLPDALRRLALQQPLFGVPITVKESCGLKGMPLCVGQWRRRGERSPGDGEAVRRMRAAGAVALCVTTTPELCLSWETNNLVTGKTLNPHDTRRTAGGSSGGEAALLGAGASVMGVASDIAGSIRVPAHFVGIFGHKPTPGYVPLDGNYPVSDDPDFQRFLVVGPLCRYAEDLPLGLRVMAGDAGARRLKLDEQVDVRKLRVSYMEDVGFSLVLLSVDAEIKQRVRRAASYLHKTFGVPVHRAHIPEMNDAVEISLSLFFKMRGIPDLLQDPSDPKRRRNLWLEALKSCVGVSDTSFHAMGFTFFYHTKLYLPDSAVPHYCNQRDHLQRKFLELLGEDGVFLFPTFPEAAMFHNDVIAKTSGVLYTMIFNVLGMPSTHVPMGMNAAGVPVGIQVVAAPHQDRLCLAVAAALEKGFGGWEPPVPKC